MKVLFSVLIANYNNGRFIKDAIESVLAQTYTNWEVVLVDDASTDNSSKVINQIAQSDDRIRIFFNETNSGCGYTKHKACELANGEILGFLDPDDVLAPNAIDVMVDAHGIKPSCGLINSNHYVCDSLLNVDRLSYGAAQIPNGHSYLTLEKGITAFATFKKDNYNQTEGINPSFKRAVDQDLYYKLEEVTQTSYIDTPLYYYRIHEGGISVNKNLHKSRYWFYKAKQDAYERRSANFLDVPNIKPNTLRAWLSLYFYTKANYFLQENKFYKFLKFVMKGFLSSPIDHLTLLKVKAVLLNTWLHRALK